LDQYLNGTRAFVEYLNNLRSEKPRQILEILQETPGLNILELAERLGIRRTAVKHHIRRLERDRMIGKVRQGRHVLHFPASFDRRKRAAICLLRVDSVRMVAEEAFRTPVLSWRELEGRTGLSHRTVRRAVRELETNELLVVERDMRKGSHRLHLHPEMRLVLAEYLSEPAEPTAEGHVAQRVIMWALPAVQGLHELTEAFRRH
jgi:predicted transcriptional regulator